MYPFPGLALGGLALAALLGVGALAQGGAPAASLAAAPVSPEAGEGAAPQVVSSLSLRRGERSIYVNQYAPSSAGGRFILRSPNCKEGERLSTVYAPEPFLVETLVGDMRILSRVVLEQQPPEGQERARLEMIDADLEIDEALRCPENVTPTGVPGVIVVEGLSTVTGTHLRYDNATGIGLLEGPVTLEREAEEGRERLSASADNMEFSLDEDRTLLRGNVTVESAGRVSEAEVFEYDESASVAVLHGSPEALASSREGTDVVSGELIEYDLVNNDVVVRGRARGTLRLDR